MFSINVLIHHGSCIARFVLDINCSGCTKYYKYVYVQINCLIVMLEQAKNKLKIHVYIAI